MSGTSKGWWRDNRFQLYSRNTYRNLQIELINANGNVIKQISQEECERLNPIKVKLGIFGIMRRITDYQQGLFEKVVAPIDDSSHVYRYGVPFKTRNMPVLHQQI